MMLGIMLVSVALAISGEGSRLAVIGKTPEFSLTTQDDKRFSSHDLDGKVLLVSFIFTTCNGSCPATTHRMGQIQQALKERGLLQEGKVHLLSFSLDPARDTTEVLRGYMRRYDADPTSWTFLTGAPAEVSRTLEAWGMWARPAANGQLDHPSRIFLVDGRRQIREIYNLDFLKAGWVADDVQLLLKEGK